MASKYLILVLLSTLAAVVLCTPESALSTYQSDPLSYYRRGRQSGYPYSNSYYSGGGYGYSQPSYNNYQNGYSGYRSPYYIQHPYSPYYQSGYRYNQNYNYPQSNNYQSGYNYNPGFGSGYSSYGVGAIPTRGFGGGYAKK